MRMPFGKHRGEDLDNVPDDYLCWVLEHVDKLSPTLREAIEDRLGIRRHRPPPAGRSFAPAPRVAEAVGTTLRDVRREMALRFHPDHGGSTAAMVAVNLTFERLDQALSQRLRELGG